MSRIYNPFVAPALLMLSLVPESDKKLGQLVSLVEAIQNTVQTLHAGLDNFYNALMEAFPAPDPDYGKSPEALKKSSNFSTKPT